MSESVIRDELDTTTKIDAIIEISATGHIPNNHKQTVETFGAAEIFAIIGKDYDDGLRDYALVHAGEFGEEDLVGMMDWLQETNPEFFGYLLRAMLEVVGDDELDDALEDSGWYESIADVTVYIDYAWVLETLGEEGAVQFESELADAVDAYLMLNGYDELSNAVILIDTRCCDCEDECTCGGDIPDEDDEEVGLPWEVVIFVECLRDMADLETAIDKEVVMPFLEKYGLIEEADDAEGTGDGPPPEAAPTEE